MTQRMDIQEFNECSGEHMHTYPQILVPMRAPLKIHIGNARYEVTQQELCLVPAGMTHCCDYVGKLLAINLSEDMLDNRDMALLSSPMIVSMRGQIVQLVELIQAEKARGTTILLSSHLLGEVEGICDRAVFIRRGRKVNEMPSGQITLQGVLEELYGPEALQRRWVEPPNGQPTPAMKENGAASW